MKTKRMAKVTVPIEAGRLKALRTEAKYLGYASVEEALAHGIDALAFRASSGSLLNSPVIYQAVMMARDQVAQKMRLDPQSLFYRSLRPDDFSSFNEEVPRAGTGQFRYVAGANRWTIRGVGDCFCKIVVVGFLVTDLKDDIVSLKVETNQNRVNEYPAAFSAGSPSDFVFLPDSPLIVSGGCRLDFGIRLGDLPGGEKLARAYPVAIGFPVCS